LFYYFAKRDYAAALSELALAQRTLPNDPDVAFYTGVVQRRQGFWEPSIAAMQRALTLDPLNAATALDLSWNYRRLKRYAEARRVLDDVLLWRPGDLGFQLIRSDIDVEENADLRRTKTILSRDLSAAPDQDLVANFRQSAACLERDYAAAAKAVAQYSSPDILDDGFLIPREYFAGVIEGGLGHEDAAQTAFLHAREHIAERVRARPADAKALITLAKIDARLGRKEEALREAEAAVQLLPVTADAFDGPLILVRFAQVCARVGEKDRALEILQEAVRLPTDATYGALRLEEEYEPLRGDARFEAIVQSLAPKPPSP
jgi:tetratricopeptide (TPR) repeat protein